MSRIDLVMRIITRLLLFVGYLALKPPEVVGRNLSAWVDFFGTSGGYVFLLVVGAVMIWLMVADIVRNTPPVS